MCVGDGQTANCKPCCKLLILVLVSDKGSIYSRQESSQQYPRSERQETRETRGIKGQRFVSHSSTSISFGWGGHRARDTPTMPLGGSGGVSPFGFALLYCLPPLRAKRLMDHALSCSMVCPVFTFLCVPPCAPVPGPSRLLTVVVPVQCFMQNVVSRRGRAGCR